MPRQPSTPRQQPSWQDAQVGRPTFGFSCLRNPATDGGTIVTETDIYHRCTRACFPHAGGWAGERAARMIVSVL